ncbi:MAG TPA: NUDIX domain-containing protein [Tepidisphaeraceae bacterium]|jgi:8-oxo-dGTP pyrophosphatase MutT (NUDIX family)|nr:NUDIX domain-containing protein [Tepidisphaeraceae bacterium]
MPPRRKMTGKKKGSTRQERSAGVIVFRKGEGGENLYLLLDYGHYWDFPKGHIEAGEEERAAALRELSEETGISDVNLLDDFRHEIVYFFHPPGRGLVRKTVVFFLGEVESEKVTISHEHVGYAWLKGQEALAGVKYPSAKQVMQAVLKHLERNPQK